MFLALNQLKQNKQFLRWCIVGLLIRLLFMPITVHGDLFAITWTSHFISQGHLDIYNYLPSIYRTEIYPPFLPPSFFLVYPPLAYYFHAGWLFILDKLHLINLDLIKVPFLYLYSSKVLFLLKIPYLAFDYATLFLLIKILKKNKEFVALIWMLNPVTIWTSYIQGSYDIIPAFFITLSLFYAKNAYTNGSFQTTDSIKSVLSLSLGACMKGSPLLLLPFFAVILGNKEFRKSLLLFTLGIAPYILIILPFGNEGFKQVFSSAVSRFVTMSFGVGQGHLIYLFLMGYFALLFYLIYAKELSFNTIWSCSLAVLSLYYLTTLWNPQYYVWIIPLLVLAIVKYYDLTILYIAQMVFFCIRLLWWGSTLTPAVFAPVNPIFHHFMGLNEVINFFYSFNKILNVFNSIFAGASIIMVYLVLRRSLSEKRFSIVQLAYDKIRLPKFLMIMLPIFLFALLFSTIVIGSENIVGVTQNKVNQPVGGLIAGESSGQTFTSPYANLNGIGVYMATYKRFNKGKAIFHLTESSSKQELVRIVFNLPDVKDNSYHNFRFPPIRDSKDGQYYFFVESPDAFPENAVTLLMNTDDVYKNGSRYKNGYAVNGDLGFRAYYKVELNDVVIDFVHKLSNEKIFLAFYFSLIVISMGLLYLFSVSE